MVLTFKSPAEECLFCAVWVRPLCDSLIRTLCKIHRSFVFLYDWYGRIDKNILEIFQIQNLKTGYYYCGFGWHASLHIAIRKSLYQDFLKLDLVRCLLLTEKTDRSPPWMVASTGHVWKLLNSTRLNTSKFKIVFVCIVKWNLLTIFDYRVNKIEGGLWW